jgi:23S rRNA (adenine2030-N6)-methyltransferase
MNYRHNYHAGNAADVFKHIVLVCLLQALCKKDKPFCYFETHAGMPLYDLNSKPSQTQREYQDGVARVWGKKSTAKPIQDYLRIIQNYNNGKDLRYYPGSATIARALLRPSDRMIISDLQPDVVAELKLGFKHDNQVNIHEQNGYMMLKACLPPKERRGLVLIDPCYEEANEWAELPKHVLTTWTRWQTGIFAIWYPIKQNTSVKAFHSALKRTGIPNILITELCPLPSDIDQRLSGSGVAIINPPWQLDETLQATLAPLLRLLKLHPKGQTKTFML